MFPARSEFDDGALSAMTRAFEQACATLNVTPQDKTQRERVAQMICEVAQSGRISEAALIEETIRRYRLAARW